MNVRTNPGDIKPVKFAIGQSVPRNEDPPFVRGEGRYTDDVNLPGQLYASFVRSPYSHGVLKGVEASAALAMKGVFGVYTGEDLTEAGYGTLKCVFSSFVNKDGSPMIQPRARRSRRARYVIVGDPIAVVVARYARTRAGGGRSRRTGHRRAACRDPAGRRRERGRAGPLR